MRIKAGTKIYSRTITIRDGNAAMTSTLLKGIEHLSLYIGKVSVMEHPTEEQMHMLLCYAGFYTKQQIVDHLGIKALMALEKGIEDENVKTENHKKGELEHGQHSNTSI